MEKLKMVELFIEIFSEEIPARMQLKAGENFSKLMVSGLKREGLLCEKIIYHTGPRRLIFKADIPLKSPDLSEEKKGPRVNAPEKAIEGFLRSAGLTNLSDARIKVDEKKGDYYYTKTEKKGLDSDQIVSEVLVSVMNNFPWPKSMKSGRSGFRWVRPLRGIICLIDGKIIDCAVDNIIADRMTEGHRRHGKGPFTVKSFSDYCHKLENEGHVMISHQDRKNKILNDAKNVCAENGLELIDDISLLDEVSGLVEWPNVLLGHMDPLFLELPSEVIKLSMRTHQKYFAVRDPSTGNLSPHFIVVSNQTAPDGGVEIAKGNGKVLSARLSDAKFFQKEDMKFDLEENYSKLDSIVFHKKLGSIRDKSERVAVLATLMAPYLNADPELVKKAARLAKCDLVTNMVVEFTSLQGQIGAMYYAAEGGNKDIVKAIEDQYKPQGPSDNVPSNSVAIAVALADKIDTLLCFWGIQEKPTGSKDPFALRRAALGVVRIILENKIKLNISNILEMAVSSRVIAKPCLPELDTSVIDSLLFFITERFKVYLRDNGMRQDLINAVLKRDANDLLSATNRVESLQAFLSTEEGINLLSVCKRSGNILKAEEKKAELPCGDVDTLTHNRAKDLLGALIQARKNIVLEMGNESYSMAMTALSKLRKPIDLFFDEVKVNDENPDIRANNLRLLIMLRDTALEIADFDAITG
jgi:glycyl-tRNA synthetase beta chain